MRRFATFLLLAALITPAPAYALCAVPVTRPKVITKDVTTVSGGIVVGTEVGYGGDGKDRGEAAQPKWTLETKTGRTKPVIVELAPGLVIYQLPENVAAGKLHDGTKVIAKVERSRAPTPMLAAPAPIKILYKEWRNPRGSSQQTIAHFKESSIPIGAIALVVVDAKTMKPRSYGLVQAGGVEVGIYGRGRCSALPNGTTPTVSGDKIILRWVDKTGAVSADSKPIVVGKAK
jgi:hypothetical protein